MLCRVLALSASTVIHVVLCEAKDLHLLQQPCRPEPFASLEGRLREGPALAFQRSAAPAYKQRTNALVDYGVQPLLPYMISRHGTPLPVAHLEGRGSDDPA